MSERDHTPSVPAAAPKPVGNKSLDSVVLARLIEEVRTTGATDVIDITAYNRTYHRHNR